MISRKTSLSANLVQFCSWLRLRGFRVGTEEESAALRAMLWVDWMDRRNFELTLGAILCKTRKQEIEFGDLFMEYWTELELAQDSKLQRQAGSQPDKKNPASGNHQDSIQTRDTGNETIRDVMYSPEESLSRKDFSRVREEELDELKNLITSISKRIAAHTLRRYERSWKPQLPDLRKTLRRNMKNGGELLEIVFRKHKKHRIRLIILCDVSRSMDPYSGFFLEFMYAFQSVYRSIETYVFGTSLHSISGWLKRTDFRAAMDALNEHQEGWGGGTRIGESLDAFLQRYAPRVLRKNSVVVILSDGIDTGNVGLLESSMKKLQSRVQQLIWLNPLAGYPLYKPEAAGMKAAFPYIDVFLTGHNAESLKALGKVI